MVSLPCRCTLGNRLGGWRTSGRCWRRSRSLAGVAAQVVAAQVVAVVVVAAARAARADRCAG